MKKRTVHSAWGCGAAGRLWKIQDFGSTSASGLRVQSPPAAVVFEYHGMLCADLSVLLACCTAVAAAARRKMEPAPLPAPLSAPWKSPHAAWSHKLGLVWSFLLLLMPPV